MPTISKSPDEAALQLTRENMTWAAEFGEVADPITYGFRATPTAHENSRGVKATFSPFTSSQIEAATLALNLWADVANITFEQVTDGDSAYTNNATILFGNYYSKTDGAAAYSNYPSTALSDPKYASGDVWINQYYQPSADSYNFMVLLHEIGHSLGLEHPGEYNAGPNIVITYSNHAEYVEDSRQYTVMSYFSAGNTGAYHGLIKPETPLMHDIVALQRAYGANLTTRTDDTVYGFNSNADRDVFHFKDSQDQGVFSIWDAGGIDTLDMSGFVQNQIISLEPGSFSSVGGLKQNVSIASEVTIENALGGPGSDIIFGNDAPNALRGLSGSDLMRGGAESDYLSGGGGRDVLYGDAGSDVLFGNGGNDRLYGSAEDDVLLGHGGKDKLRGGPGSDHLFGGGQKDILVGGSGADVFDFSRISESKIGGAKRDKITDFDRRQDHIDLRDIDAKKGSGNQTFKWIGKKDFHDKKGELRYEDKGSKVLVQGDVNGDGKPDFELFVKIGALGSGDFVL